MLHSVGVPVVLRERPGASRVAVLAKTPTCAVLCILREHLSILHAIDINIKYKTRWNTAVKYQNILKFTISIVDHTGQDCCLLYRSYQSGSLSDTSWYQVFFFVDPPGRSTSTILVVLFVQPKCKAEAAQRCWCCCTVVYCCCTPVLSCSGDISRISSPSMRAAGCTYLV